MSSQNPFLWLPRQAPVIRAEDSAASESIVVTLTFKEIYGSQPTWNNLETELAPYSLERIVDVVCRINVLLYQAPRSWDPKTQHRVCQGLFGPAETPRVLQAALEFNKKRRQNGMVAPFLLFHEQQTLNLLKAAFLLKNLDDRNEREIPNGIGRALLMMNSLANSIDPPQLDSEPAFFDRWLSYVLAKWAVQLK